VAIASAASRSSGDVMRRRVRYRTIIGTAFPVETSCEVVFARDAQDAARPAPVMTLLGPRRRTTEAQQTSGERRTACDRRVQVDQADSDAPLTALCLCQCPGLFDLLFHFPDPDQTRTVLAQ
jgi:hypothetical protein